MQVDNGRLREDGYDVVVDLADVAAAAAAAAVARVLAEQGFAEARVVVADVVVERDHAQARAVRVDGLVDPRTGAPAAPGPARCVVDAGDAVTAAALAHACLVLSEAEAKKVAAALGATLTAS